LKYKMVFIVVLMVCAICFSAQPANADNGRAYRFFVAGETAFAITPVKFTDYYIMGYGLMAGVEYPVSPVWSVIGLLDIKMFNPDEGLISDWWDDEGEYPGATNIEVSEGKLTAVTIGALSKGQFKKETSKVFPYIKGGFGITISGSKEIKIEWDNAWDGSRQTDWQGGLYDQTNISVIIGAGLEAKIGSGNMSMFFDVGMHILMQDEVSPNVIPITFGLKF